MFAANLQRTYTVNDDVYKRIERLTREASVLGPSSFSPMSGKVLEIALNRIDTKKLSHSQLEEYNYLYNEVVGDLGNHAIFYSDNWGFDAGVQANAGFNFEDYDRFNYVSQPVDHRNDNMIPYRYQNAFLSIHPKIYFGNNIFLEGKFEFKNNNMRDYESSLGVLLTNVNGSAQGLFAGDFNIRSNEIPYRAGASIGNDFFHFVIGRYPHSIGNGITGNLMVGDNFNYQEISNLSFISNYFTYNISITRFDQMLNMDNGFASMSRSEFDGMQQFRVVHRFDLNLFDKVRFAVDLATIYNSHYGFDLRFFYPFVISHNYYNYTNQVEKEYFDEANNLMSFYLEAVPVKGLSLNLQFAVDQFQLFYENSNSIPSAWGLLANAKYSMELSQKGVLDLYFEFVYTNPYLYLNGKREADKLDYNLDYIVGYYSNRVSDYGYSGYQFGPDNIVFALGTEYDSRNYDWRVGAKAIYRISGQKRLGNSDGNTIDMGNSVIEDDSSVFMNTVTPTGGFSNAEHLLQPVIYGSYTWDYYNLEVYVSSAFSTYFNYDFHKGETRFLPQFTIGVRWKGINTDWFK